MKKIAVISRNMYGEDFWLRVFKKENIIVARFRDFEDFQNCFIPGFYDLVILDDYFMEENSFWLTRTYLCFGKANINIPVYCLSPIFTSSRINSFLRLPKNYCYTLSDVFVQEVLSESNNAFIRNVVV